MPRMSTLDELQPDEREGVRLVLQTLDTAVNIVTGTLAAAVVQTPTEYYPGANLWLSGPSHIHAEAAAFTAANSAGDRAVSALYLAQRRVDGKEAALLLPCGSCRQLVFDFAVFSGVPVRIYSVTDRLDGVQITEHAELLPDAFESQRLRAAGEELAAARVS